MKKNTSLQDRIKYLLQTPAVILLSGLAPAFSLNTLLDQFGMWGIYAGVADFGRGFLSTVFYIISVMMLRRMCKEKDHRLMILSVLSGLWLSARTCSSVYLIYQNDLFRPGLPALILLLQFAGLSLFTVPLSREVLSAISILANRISFRASNDFVPPPHTKIQSVIFCLSRC